MPKSLLITLFAVLYLYTCALKPVAGSAISTTSSSWHFAVASKSKILFYDESWQLLFSSAHQFEQLTTLTFDDTEEVVYFSDQEHNQGSIFSLKIPISTDDPHIIEKVVQRTQNDSIRSIAYDPLDRNIYWSDAKLRKIFSMSVSGNDKSQDRTPKVFVDFENKTDIPDGLALDICRRKLYWTNSDPNRATVERIDLTGKQREVIVNTEMHLPHGIVVDQISDRIYWVVDQQGVHFSVESAKLDGSDRHVIVHGLDKVPSNLAVTRDAIYWTDLANDAIWSHPKYSSSSSSNEKKEDGQIVQEEPKKVASFLEKTRGIVARNNFFQTLQNDQHCSDVVSQIKQRLLTPKVTRSPHDEEVDKMNRAYCLNNGTYVEESGMCICHVGFKGVRCESSECHNYCVHGTCVISNMGFPKCYCQEGFYGERCQSSKCAGFCFNDGVCKIDAGGEPTCECSDNYGGQHCEHNSTEICSLFCRILKHEPDAYVPFGCHNICENLVLHTEDGKEIYATPRYTHLEICDNHRIWTSYVLVALIAGVVACLSLIAVIVHGLRRIYKPARPRIKKTFVVRKQARTNSSSDTPLTNRPLATEQCEITIENCCNMNICETPCFDPKLVEQTLSCDSKARVKEDKKILINSMEDELY